MILENEFLTLEVNEHGAELSRIRDKQANREVLWNGDPKFWNRHAPLLFPNVGKTFRNIARYGGKEYPTKQHGFARDSEFTLTRQTEDTLVYTLTSSPESKRVYPYDFRLEAGFTLHGREIRVFWRVTNTGKETMYFTIGAHPAFNVPEAYEFDFGDLEAVRYHLLDSSGTMLPETYTLPLKDGKCPFRADMFDNDALIVDDQIERVSLLIEGKAYVTVRCPSFPSFGIWSKPGAPFVCLEPWQGRCDDFGFTGDMREKKNVTSLSPDAVFEQSYTVTVD